MRVLSVFVAALSVLSQLGDAQPSNSNNRDLSNRLKNGDFGNGLVGFETEGTVNLLKKKGANEDGDVKNIVELVVDNTYHHERRFSKRILFGSSSILSFLTDLVTKKTYTVTFKYAVTSSSAANSCQIQVYMGLISVGTTPFFPKVDAGSALNWLTFSSPVTVIGSSSAVRTVLYCGNRATAKVQMDTISVTDGDTTKVTTTSKITTSTTLSTKSTTISTSNSIVAAAVTTSTTSTTSSQPTSTSSSSTTSVITSSTIISSTTTSAASSTASSTTSSTSSTASSLASGTVDSTILVIGSTDYLASTANLGLLAYGIPYQNLIVPQAGIDLPVLNSSLTSGNFGGIIIVDSVSYNYDGTWKSALTDAQWNAMYAYQTTFNVRMVRINEFPGPSFGVSAVGAGCCGDTVEQLISITNTSDFPTARIKTNAGLSTKGLYHVPATITDSTTTRQVAKFGVADGFTSESVAAVINNFNGREQFVWFITWAPDWSQTSSFLQHSHIHWITRGLFLGKRKVHLSPQIDDLQLSTELYYPAGQEFKLRTGDLEAHITWQTSINSRMPAGSDFRLEFGHNGNGDFISATALTSSRGICVPDYAIDYTSPNDTALEFMKPLGTGTNLWPDEFQQYSWSKTCAALDSFALWFQNANNINNFAHVSHTFTHLELNNATYADASREIHFNQAWMTQMGIDKATRFSVNGLIPPAITGLHNGDVIKAWLDNGIKYVVGDNTRPVLRNPDNKYWPLISTVASNGYDGLVIVPRFATTIYYNCDTADCTTREWIATSAGSGTYTDLLNLARSDNTRYLLSLMADPYMFHQANMRQTDAATITIGTQTGKMSLVMSWTETIVQELIRLTDWPIRSLKHDDVAQYFLDKKTVDDCNPKLSYTFSDNGHSIKTITVTANGNTCAAPIPVTIPSGSVSVSGGTVTADQVGNEPPIQWITLSGSPVTLTLGSPLTF